MENKVNIIYASISGNTQIACEQVQSLLNEQHIETNLSRVQQTDITTFVKGKYFIIATSTWEHGLLNPYWNNILNLTKSLDFSEKTFMFLGLGDKRYESVEFCAGIDKLQQHFTSRHGKQIGEVLKIDGDVYTVLNTQLKDWVWSLLSELRMLNK